MSKSTISEVCKLYADGMDIPSLSVYSGWSEESLLKLIISGIYREEMSDTSELEEVEAKAAERIEREMSDPIGSTVEYYEGTSNDLYQREEGDPEELNFHDD